MRVFKRELILLGSLAFLMVLPAPARAGAIAHLVLDSQPGDFVGGGKHSDVTYTPQNTANGGLFSPQILTSDNVNGQPAYLRFVFSFPVTTQPSEFALLDFGTNKLGVPIAVGTYTDAQRASFATPGHPGLDVEFENRGSNTLTGEFTINTLSFDKDTSGNLQIAAFDVNFTQFSDGSTAALNGHFTYSAVPEPASIILFGLGLPLAVCFQRWRTRRR
jgi:hypothetical protein